MPIFNDNISKVLSGVKDVDKKLSFSVEFIPANVVYSVVDSGDIVTKKSKDGNLESSKIVNAIYVTKYGEDVNSSVGPYYPLFRGLVDTPTRGDSVLVCEFPVGDTNYYIGPINSLNLPSFNPDEYMLMEKIKHTTVDSNISGEADSEYLTGYPKTIGMLPIARLQKPYRKELDDPNDSYETKGMSSEEYVRGVGSIGDYVIEGRFGNSIRFGSRSSNPNMIISNGRFPLGGIEAKDSKYETLNDGTLISFSTKGKLNDHFDVEYIPSCNDEKKNTKYLVEYDSEYDGPQSLFRSYKIILDSHKEKMLLSSNNDLDIASAQSINIVSNQSTVIETPNIYLGKQSKEKTQPLVLGTTLKELLEELVGIIESLKVTGCIAGMSGPIDPMTIQKVQSVKQKLSAPEFWSEYHFIEDNGQKP